MHFRLIALFAATAFWSFSVHAGTILQEQFNSGAQIEAFEPIGQSFTAEDAHIKFAFHYDPFNTGFAVDTLRVGLLDGEGLNGDVLGDVEFVLPAGYYGFYDVDFSALTLTVGNVYTALVSVPGNSPYWGVLSATFKDAYHGGQAYQKYLPGVPGYDMTFRVTPVAQEFPAEVPEPGSAAVLALGLVALGLRRVKDTLVRSKQ